ncbi:serine hydrolase [Puniceibacterium sp. IMCC21224]|uniref:serine hydrolase domain-containing protein n=1 Tax=Puniceibacterium sp. IMCC21224 TaxID=1618204 RepID=UPI00064DFE08|nr:serine hydrolase domain-containing protein [Puniceibacterium sp. IMCC21224]KMK68679.1 penicillin-binding protein, beta-lactamase class C [Puniceibacterium sp. IMCC21224]
MPPTTSPTGPRHSAWITGSGHSGTVGDATALFPYWSFTKTVIAICALRLAEVGTLTLNTRPDDMPWTLSQLLQHSAGLRDYGQWNDYHRAVANGGTPWPRDDVRDRALSAGPLFAPGDGWSYSNVGYILAIEMIEAASGKPLSQLIADLITVPLGLRSVRLASTCADFANLHWPDAARYDPGWVYHGCLTGTAPDAARLLDAVMTGALLAPPSLAAMNDVVPLGGAIPGRPWKTCGYGLGLMSGTVAHAGRAIGHSGAGPFCVNAVYHFPDRADPITVASFASGHQEGEAEHTCTALALKLARDHNTDQQAAPRPRP